VIHWHPYCIERGDDASRVLAQLVSRVKEGGIMSIIRVTKEQVVNARKDKEKSFEEDVEFKAYEGGKERGRKKTIEQSEKEDEL